MKVILSDRAGSTTGVPGVFEIVNHEAGTRYVVHQATLPGGEGVAEANIMSIGKSRASGQVFGGTDLRFLNHPGFTCLWPEWKGQACDLAIEPMDDEPGRWQGVVQKDGLNLYGTQAHTSREQCEAVLMSYVKAVGLVAAIVKEGAE